MRCSEPGTSVVVAIIASRVPGRRAWVVRPLHMYKKKRLRRLLKGSMKTKWSAFLVGVLVGLGIAIAMASTGHRDGTRPHYGLDYATFDISGGTLKPVWPKR